MPGRPQVCVVGYGVAGRLHHRLLDGLGIAVSVVDPTAHALTTTVPVAARIQDVPADRRVDVWSVCTPTATHVETVAALLARDPEARILVEKPVCRSWEGPELTALLEKYPHARLVVMNQYAHAQGPAVLKAVKKEFAPRTPVDAIRIAFSKDRREDIEQGRFVDRDYGVFGYEWLHMLALLGALLPAEAYHRYLLGDPAHDRLRISPDPQLLSTAAHDTVRLAAADPSATAPTEVELYSTIVGPDAAPGAPAPRWARRPGRAADSRQRVARVEAGAVRLTLELDPVSLPNGTPLPRNMHRLTMDRPDGRREWLINDSPMENALRHAVAALLAHRERPELDLRPIDRITALAALGRTGASAAAVPAALPTRL